MIVTKSRRYHVNLGNFEWVEFGAEVTIDSEKTIFGPDVIETELKRYLDPELDEARLNTDEKSSFVHFLAEEPTKGKK
jgi:zona occludens toxin (predicted ATPase)